MTEWFRPAGTLSQDGWEVVVDQRIDEWTHTGLRVATLLEGESCELPASDLERVLVPITGSFVVEYSAPGGRGRQVLAGRASVFHGPTDVLYLGAQSSAVVTGSGRIAVAEAPANETFPARYIAATEVAIELRGAGTASRQVHNFGTPANLAASRIIVCEVLTPAGNWSSYPPHKHDEHVEGSESQLEEIYYFEAAPSGEGARNTAPFGLHRTSSSPAGTIEVAAEVHSGDVALVPFGWHGPCAAAPGYDLYYLNVMAGPGAERAWNITVHPAHAWIAEGWAGTPIDPRLPFTRADRIGK